MRRVVESNVHQRCNEVSAEGITRTGWLSFRPALDPSRSPSLRLLSKTPSVKAPEIPSDMETNC